jgi:endonuclease YncB( thermonuclease family)
MKIFLYTLIVLALSAFTPGQSPQAKMTPNVADSIEGKVVSVENGDTVIVEVKGPAPHKYQVKLQAIDAPDIGQPHFENSRNSLSKLIYKRDVKVVVRTTYAKGMIIGTVFYDGRDIGLALLEKGLAWHYKRFAYQQQPAERKSYIDAQEYALTAGIGIWSDERPTPPWVFRGEGTSTTADRIENGSGKQLPAQNVLHNTSSTLPVSRETESSEKTLPPAN